MPAQQDIQTNRLFIGLQVPDILKEKLSAESLLLPNEIWNPTKREAIHITALWLGDVPSRITPHLHEILNNVAERSRAFQLVGGRTIIMNPDEPYMLWLRFDRNRWFEELVTDLEDCFWRIGTWKNQRDRKQRRQSGDKYAMPHITLARARGGRLLDSLMPPFDASKDMQQMKCGALSLIQSIHDKKTGETSYTELYTVQLGG